MTVEAEARCERLREQAEKLLAVPFSPDSRWEAEAREVLAALAGEPYADETSSHNSREGDDG